MYFSSGNQSFRCGEGGVWTDCGIIDINHAYSVTDDFLDCNSNAPSAPPGWTAQTIGAAVTYTCNTNSSADHPGTVVMTTTATINQGSTLDLGGSGSWALQTDQVFKTAVRTPAALTNVDIRVGFHNETTATNQPTTGVWWELNSTNAVPGDWYYCAAGLATPCVDSGVAAVASTWFSLGIRMTSPNAATFQVANGSGNPTTMTTAAGLFATGAVAPAMTIFDQTSGTANTLEIDYVQVSGVTSARR
jgi:hypothetical protein